MLYIIDAYTWVEYFIDSKKGKLAARIIDNKTNLIITPESTLAEIYFWCYDNDKNFGEAFNILKRMSDISPISITNWIVAASIRIAKRRIIKDFGLMDSLLLAKQIELKAKIVTGDKHFKELKDVIYIGD